MKKIIIFLISLSIIIISCGGNSDKAKVEEQPQVEASELGIGPIKEVKLTALDPALAEKGKEIFDSKCAACHKLDQRYVGPAMKGVTQRRKPEFIMNMILNPEQMTKENPIAKQLLGEYMTQMTNQNMNEADTRAILEYFRSVDNQK